MSPQPPAVMAAMFVLAGAVMAIVTLGSLTWYLVLRRATRGEPILEHEPRREAAWGIIDLIAAFVLWVLLMPLTGAIVRAAVGPGAFEEGGAESKHAKLYLIAGGGLAQIATGVAIAALIIVRTPTSLRDLGFSSATFISDLTLGIAAFCALAIPTFGLQALLVQFWKSEHPLIESLKASPDPQFLAVAMFMAVIAAPLTEEFAFRVLFQGWLERIIGEAVGTFPTSPAETFGQADFPPPVPAWSEPSTDLALPVPPVAIADPFAPSPGARWIADWIPIYISAAVFAVLHINHGPDFITLFVLALGLGYLYRRTHRITPSLVVHFLLNFVSMLALCVEIYRVKS